MNDEQHRRLELERFLGTMFSWGTWIASTMIGLGLIGAYAHLPDSRMILAGRIVLAGIGVFILLPVLRVVAMLVAFIREREYRFGLIAALVVTIIAMAALLGIYTASGPSG